MQIQPTPSVAITGTGATPDVVPVTGKDAVQSSGAQSNAAQTGTAQAGAAQATIAVNQSAVELSSAVQKSPQQTLRDSLKQLNEAVQKTQPQLEFSVDEETDIHIVKLVDNDSGKVVSQFPSKQAIELAKSIDQLSGMLLKARS